MSSEHNIADEVSKELDSMKHTKLTKDIVGRPSVSLHLINDPAIKVVVIALDSYIY